MWSAACAGAVLGLAACGSVQMDLAKEGNPNRVLTGTVEFSPEATLPANAVVVVRVLGVVPANPQVVSGLLGEQPVAGAPAEAPPQVLGEQTIKSPAQTPVPFRIEYAATDDQLRAGLRVEARVSYGSALRWFNVNSYSVNLNNAEDVHTVTVNPAGG
jgi:uncharacterized lipoprotein YbaY